MADAPASVMAHSRAGGLSRLSSLKLAVPSGTAFLCVDYGESDAEVAPAGVASFASREISGDSSTNRNLEHRDALRMHRRLAIRPSVW